MKILAYHNIVSYHDYTVFKYEIKCFRCIKHHYKLAINYMVSPVNISPDSNHGFCYVCMDLLIAQVTISSAANRMHSSVLSFFDMQTACTVKNAEYNLTLQSANHTIIRMISTSSVKYYTK